MYYITVPQKPRFHQITLNELFSMSYDAVPNTVTYDNTGTSTRTVESISDNVRDSVDVRKMVEILRYFNNKYRQIREADRHSQYYVFKIPKHSGGLRTISAPNEDLKQALYDLKKILEDFGASYHTSSFAYVKGRNCKSALVKHQNNKSKWFAKLDFHDFFGTCNMEYTIRTLSRIFPFCLIMESCDGMSEMVKALELCFLDDKLPQGTPISPMLTNIIMIPMDHYLCNTLRHYKKSSFVYTRYADDMLISCQYQFGLGIITSLVRQTIQDFNAPFILNDKKSRIGSSAGQNFNLGLMLNANNEITIGNRRINQFKTMLHQFATDWKNNTPWNLSDTQHLQGLVSYYQMVYRDDNNPKAPTTIDRIIDFYCNKEQLDIRAAIKDILKVNAL